MWTSWMRRLASRTLQAGPGLAGAALGPLQQLRCALPGSGCRWVPFGCGNCTQEGSAASGALHQLSLMLPGSQDLISSVRSGVPMPVRQATARAAAAAGRLDRTVVLGTGVAVLGGLLAAAVARNHRLSHALRDKDRDMTQLVMKVRPHTAPACTWVVLPA